MICHTCQTEAYVGRREEIKPAAGGNEKEGLRLVFYCRNPRCSQYGKEIGSKDYQE